MMAHILSSVQGANADVIPIRRALLSVSDKTGLLELATFLHEHGVELLSTGGSSMTFSNCSEVLYCSRGHG